MKYAYYKATDVVGIGKFMKEHEDHLSEQGTLITPDVVQFLVQDTVNGFAMRRAKMRKAWDKDHTEICERIALLKKQICDLERRKPTERVPLEEKVRFNGKELPTTKEAAEVLEDQRKLLIFWENLALDLENLLAEE